MPKLAPPSFNGVNLPPDLRRVLEAAMRPAVAALNKALVVGDSLQVWGPLLVTGTGAGTVGVTGSGTAGSIPKWSGSSALADSGASMDGSNRLAVPVGIAFPGGSHLDSAPTAASAVGGTGAVQYANGTAFNGGEIWWDTVNQVFQLANSGHPSIAFGPPSGASGLFTGIGLETTGNPGLELWAYNKVKIYGNNAAVGRHNTVNVANSGASVEIWNGHPSDPGLAVIATATQTGKIQEWRANDNTTVLAAVDAGGKLIQAFTDSSATPGAATINKPTGRSAIAAGASSVVITNSLVTAASQVKITKRQFDATLTDHIEVCAAGSFTVTGNAAATAAWAFDWQVLN